MPWHTKIDQNRFGPWLLWALSGSQSQPGTHWFVGVIGLQGCMMLYGFLNSQPNFSSPHFDRDCIVLMVSSQIAVKLSIPPPLNGFICIQYRFTLLNNIEPICRCLLMHHAAPVLQAAKSFPNTRCALRPWLSVFTNLQAKAVWSFCFKVKVRKH